MIEVEDALCLDGFDGATAHRFLRSILPPTGPYCPYAREIHPPPVHSLGQAVSWLAAHARRDCHIALAGWQGARGRSKGTFAGARAFWADIDVGEGKDYTSQYQAIDALNTAIAAGLPNPTIVNSGNGLHLVWVLYEIFTEWPEWEARARGLGAWLDQHGLRFDHARLTDCANGPRVPGTLNTKCNEIARVARWGNVMLRLIDWDRLIPPLYEAQPLPRPLDPDLDLQFSASPIAERCAQMRAFRDGAHLPEPVWKACLDVLAHCRDGEQYAHQWSAHDPRYKPEETAEKFARSREVRPATCKRFQTINPTTCQNCPERIKSPISLGRVDPPPDLPTYELPGKYFLRQKDHTICHRRDDQTIPVCSELYVTDMALVRGERKYCFVHIEPDGRESSFWLDRHECEGEQLRKKIHYRSARALETYIAEATSAAEVKAWNARKMTDLYKTFGWQNDYTTFVHGSMLLTHGPDIPHPQIHSAQTEIARAQDPAGSFEKWKCYARQIAQPGMEANAFLLCLSAGAPIHSLIAPNEGGILVLLRSNASGRGKSTALAAALSIWGHWAKLSIANTGTMNSQIDKFGTLRHLPIGWDDALTADLDKFYNLVMEFSEGHPRERLNRDGTPKVYDQKWSTYLLGTTNSAVRLRMATSKNANKGGLARILELDANTSSRNDGGDLYASFDRHYGHAGRRLIAGLLDHSETIATMQETLLRVIRERMQRLDWGPDYRLISRAITCAEAGGKLLCKIGLDLDVTQIIATVERQIDEERTQEATGENVVNAYLRENNAHLVVVGGSRPPHVVREIKARYEVNSRRLFLPLGEYRRWCASLDMSQEEMHALLRKQDHHIQFDNCNLTKDTNEPANEAELCAIIQITKAAAAQFNKENNIINLPPR